MAFKRVLSSVLVVVLLVCTLCAFKPIDLNFDVLEADSDVIYVPQVELIFVNGTSWRGQYILVQGWNNRTIRFDGYAGDKGVDSVSSKSADEGEYYYLLPAYESATGKFYYDFTVYGVGNINLQGAKVEIIQNYVTASDPSNEVIYSEDLLYTGPEPTPPIVINDYEQIRQQVLYFYCPYVSESQGTGQRTIRVYLKPPKTPYEQGYDAGLEIGYNNGFAEGRADGIANGLYGMFTDPIGALLNFVIVPFGDNGGITLGSIFLVLVAISLIVIYLKYFAGG